MADKTTCIYDKDYYKGKLIACYCTKLKDGLTIPVWKEEFRKVCPNE